MSPTNNLKFRPSLTLSEIEFILASIQWAANPQQAELMRKLEVFTLKAKHGITKASHVLTPRQSLGASLGMEPDDSMETLLALWNSPDTRKALSASQLARIQHHRYINDLMSPEEEKIHEQLNA